MREFLLVLGGALIGSGVSYMVLEHKMDNKHMAKAQEQVLVHKRALDEADKRRSQIKNVFEEDEGRPDVEIDEGQPTLPLEDAPRPITTEELNAALLNPDYFQPKSEEGEGFSPATDNPYHTAVAAVETSPETFVTGEINQYGVSYIEEEEYEDEEDGFAKEQIVIMMDEHNPVFLQDGGEIRDWDEKVGDSILIDMFRFCPPGKRQVLYVRNHTSMVDYEVVRDTP